MLWTRHLATLVIALTLSTRSFGQTLQVQITSASPKWEAAIKAFEAADKTNPPPQGALVFVGSSTIRLWETLAQDFPTLNVINRGFGGSEMADAVAFADRIVLPYKPKMVVLYAGDNDIAEGKSPQQVLADFKRFVEKIHAALPDTRIAFLAIKPSPLRWHLVKNIEEANRSIADFCKGDNRLTYIDVFHPMLGADGKPRPELFVKDQLHLNAKGYTLWAEIIRRELSRALPHSR